MRNRSLVLLLPSLLTAALLGTHHRPASAEVVIVNPSARQAPSRAARLRANAALDPDTVWIGHINDPTWIPKRTDGSNVPGVPAGGYGPFKVGRGPNLPGTTNGYQGVWDFDRFQAGETDSLQGWLPVTIPYGSVGASNVLDRQRPFFGFDYGNQGNHLREANQRSRGVTGYWHRDPGNNVPGLPDTGAVVPGPDVEWAPLGGSFSAWCGLRAEGDLTVQDAPALGGTGNYFNAAVLQYNGNATAVQIGSNSPNGTDHNFPGYGSQMDQMLYRDVTLADNAAFNLSFQFRTSMSTGRNTASNTRVGWFDKDPIATVALNDGNFISSSDAGVNAPVDSFMVYIGVPVEPAIGPDNDFTASDGLGRELYDAKRRWFSEVIAIDKPYRELFTTFGVNAAQTKTINVAGGAGTIVQQILDAQAGAGGTVRLVFRVKTNRGFDDQDHGESGFSSGTAGAALVDDVTVNGWAAANGDFESSGSINNDAATAATSAWKSTGKPPGVFFHVHDLAAGLPYEDPCGAVGTPNRICNMAGRVVTAGDHDNAEKPGGLFGANDQDRQHWLASPTINLRSNGPGDYNAMGIDSEIADVTGNLWLEMDVYVNLFQFNNTANGTRVGWQSYPALQANGAKCWGEVRKTIAFSSYDGTTGCGNGAGFAPEGAFAIGDLIPLPGPAGTTDSLRAYIEELSICFRRPVTGVQCSPSSGPYAGGYYDNLSIGFIDGATPSQLSLSIWNVWNDCFPTSSASGLAGTPAFDTLAARVQTGYNTAPTTGTLQRNVIPGDSLVVSAGGSGIRTDLVFRIVPGVGNYSTIGNRNSRLRKRPDAGGGAGNQVLSGDGSFWGSYMANNGPFGGTNAHNQAGGIWDPNTWHSARMDTAEINIFPCTNVAGNLPALTAGIYVSQYHESEVAPGALRNSLGTPKNRCFLVDVSSGASTNAGNINCGTTDALLGGQYPPPAWQSGGVPVAGTGLDANEDGAAANSLPIGQTYEFTKIVPDGQLTPGAHVQYFYRKSDVSSPGIPTAHLPDTFVIFPQNTAGPSFDGERWFHFGVLPDRWKDPAFGTGGTGMACMLVVDLGSRRGDELTWVAMADSIGMTAPNKYGAHNGWHARGDQDITRGVNPASTPPGDPSMAMRAHGGQPGSQWDLYQVVAGESNVPAGRLGSRSGGAATSNPPFSSTVGKTSTHGPTGEVLRAYYRNILFLAADLGLQSIGPLADQTDNDIGLLTDFLTNPVGGTTPRGMIAMGRDLVEGQATDHPTFFPTQFGASLRAGDYRSFAPNLDDAPDLAPVPPVNNVGSIYGVFSPCSFNNDVLNVATTGAEGGAFYENAGSGSPHIAAVYFPDGVAGHTHARTLVGGWTLGALGGMGSRYTLRSGGTFHFWASALSSLLGALSCEIVVGIGDDPGSDGTPFVDFLGLRSENPSRSGEARIAFGITRTGKVEIEIYDVTGRRVRTVANRVFAGGQEHVVTWDGTDDAGRRVARGVYFYRLRSPSLNGEKKLILLAN